MVANTTCVSKRYLVHHLLGQGGMGVVYSATDRLTGDFVALKQVTAPPDFMTDTPSDNDFEVALSNEFRTLASLRHPNIISVLDYGFEEKQPYFTMELLQSPRTILAASKDTPFEIRVNLLLELLQALVYLHRRGVLHRDLKPGNILVTQRQAVKVLDFGLSVAGAYSRSNIQEKAAGTLAYMAPELFTEEHASIASDLYAVGVIACEVLAGRHPFNQKNVALLINSILSTPPDLSGLDGAVYTVVERLLAKDPCERYGSASEVIAALCQATNQPVPVESSAIRESFLQAAKFVGRDQELAELKAVLSATVKAEQVGNGTVPKAWLIGGESGVGKTRLTDELRIRALVYGALVLRGQAITGGSIPYQIWRDPLRRLVLSSELNDTDASVLKSLVDDIETLLERPIAEPPPLDPKLSQMRFMRVVIDLFRALKQPTVVILEDLQWATDENLELLKRLIPLTTSLPLLLIANFRDDERPELCDVLSGMQFLKLHRLDESSVGELSTSILGDTGQLPQIVDWLYQETEGNVFFLIEMVRELAARVGELDLINPQHLPAKLMPDGIHSIIQRRLNRVPPDAQPLLQLAALAGRGIDIELLSAFATDLPRWLEVCNLSGVLDVEQDRWRFAHDKLREGIIAQIHPAELPAMHHKLAVTLEQVHPGDPAYIPAIARHYQRAGIRDKATTFLAQAGDLARASFANHEAISFYRAALDELAPGMVDEDPNSHTILITVLENLGGDAGTHWSA